MKSTRDITPAQHPSHKGSPQTYQRAALAKYSAHRDEMLSPWCYVTTGCKTDMCLRVDCMNVHHPQSIAYPAGICVYCGDPSGSRDHLLPRAWTGGGAYRNIVATIPACADCNSRINDTLAVSVTERRAVAHDSIRRKYRGILANRDRTEREIAEYGHAMQSVIRKNINKRAWVRGRLDWPTDPNYDVRAFERTGIENPESLGLL